MLLVNVLTQGEDDIALLKLPIMPISLCILLDSCVHLSNIDLLRILPLEYGTPDFTLEPHAPILPLKKSLICQLLLSDQD